MARSGIPESVKKKALNRAHGYCQRCRLDFDRTGIVPDFHKNGNNRDHRLSNIEVLCPNCHRKATLKNAPSKDGVMNSIDGQYSDMQNKMIKELNKRT